MKRIKNKKPFIFCLIALLVSLLVLYLVYHVIDKRAHASLSRSPEYRAEIETPGKKWLNGYFGVFFRFKYLGNINWLAVPLVLWFLLTGKKKKRERWQMALAFVWLVTLLFLGLKGYYNSRYLLTLFPFTAAGVLLLSWQLLKDKKNHLKILCFSLLALMCLYNIYHYFAGYTLFWELRVSRKNIHFPHQLVNYLNSRSNIAAENSRVFVFNQPLYYYYTNKNGIDYVNPFSYEIFLGLRQKESSRRKLYLTIRKKFKVKYILIGWAEENEYQDRMFAEFLNCECKLLLNDNGYRLYEIRDRFLNRELRKGGYKKIEAWDSLSLSIQGIRGEFDISKDKKTGMATVSNLTPNKKGQRLIQLGFRASGKKGKIEIPAGQYIHFLVTAKIPKHLINKDNYIFIQDLTDKWERQRLYFRAHLWRTYLISRKIRESSSDVMLGFRFAPQSTRAMIKIKNIQVYVSDKPL